MKKKDLVIILAALLLALALYALSQMTLGGEAAQVVVTVGGEEVLRRPLAVSDTYEIRQEDGDVNIICVENGAVFMQEANCRDGLCIRQGRMKNAAKTIVCLPHELVIRLEGEPLAPAEENMDDLDIIL